jgi:predicted porin
MKKQHLVKLSLAAAVGVGTLAGSNAMADVTVFGIADAGIMNSKAPGGTGSTSLKSGGMSTSAFGIKGSEELGNGMKANFGLSAFLDFSNGSFLTGFDGGNYLFTREAWVGLSTKDAGSFTLGRDVNPSFIPHILFNAFGDSTTYSPLWHATYFDSVLGTSAANNNVAKISAQSRGLYDDTAWSNQIRYTTPSMGGVVADINYAPNSTGDNFGANAMYFDGPIGLSAYYMETRTRSTGSLDTDIYATHKPAKVYFVGGSYNLGIAKVFASYQTGKQVAAVTTEATTYHFSAQIPAGPGKVLVSYADTQTTNASSAKFAQTAIGYLMPMSKTTDVYANYLYGTEKTTATSNGNAFGVGIRKFF